MMYVFDTGQSLDFEKIECKENYIMERSEHSFVSRAIVQTNDKYFKRHFVVGELPSCNATLV